MRRENSRNIVCQIGHAKPCLYDWKGVKVIRKGIRIMLFEFIMNMANKLNPILFSQSSDAFPDFYSL
jgi:hypothetical protein